MGDRRSSMMASWIAGADGSGFGIENLPLGIFACEDAPRPGVAIGPSIVGFLSMLVRERLLDDETLLDARKLNDFLAHGPGAWRSLRTTLQRLLGDDATDEERDAVTRALVPRDSATMHLPIDVKDYVDFYSGIEHATNAGKIVGPRHRAAPAELSLPADRLSWSCEFRRRQRHADSAGRMGNVKLPTGGAGRSVRRNNSTSNQSWRWVSHRPRQQARRADPGRCRARPRLRLRVAQRLERARHLRPGRYDRSARSWPSRSPRRSRRGWFRSTRSNRSASRTACSRPRHRCRHLRTSKRILRLRHRLRSTAAIRAMRGPIILPPATVISRTNFREMYWNVAQQLAHMTSNGSRVRAGDLFGSGTISGSAPGTYGSLLELTKGGAEPLALPSGERRAFLEDGDTVILRGSAGSGATRVDLGEVVGTIG